MSEKDFLGDVKRAKEEEYFHRKEMELKERLRRKAQEEAEKAQLGAELGVKDEETLQLLVELGYDHETVSLLHLIPLIQIAWADGVVSGAERHQLLELAWVRGVEKDGPVQKRLEEMLSHRPPAETFDKALRAIRAILDAQPEDRRDATRNDLVATAHQLAEASRGFFGFGKRVSEEEKAILEKLAQSLSTDHEAGARETLQKTQS